MWFFSSLSDEIFWGMASRSEVYWRVNFLQFDRPQEAGGDRGFERLPGQNDRSGNINIVADSCSSPLLDTSLVIAVGLIRLRHLRVTIFSQPWRHQKLKTTKCSAQEPWLRSPNTNFSEITYSYRFVLIRDNILFCGLILLFASDIIWISLLLFMIICYWYYFGFIIWNKDTNSFFTCWGWKDVRKVCQ